MGRPCCLSMWTFVILLLTLGLAQSQKKNLEDFEDFVIGSCCGVEAFYPDGKLEVTKLEGCSKCFEAAKSDGEAVKSCTKEHLPNFYSRCKDKVESLNSPRNEVLQCYVDSIKDLDTNGEVKQGVKEFLGLCFTRSIVIATIVRQKTSTQHKS